MFIVIENTNYQNKRLSDIYFQGHKQKPADDEATLGL